MGFDTYNGGNLLSAGSTIAQTIALKKQERAQDAAADRALIETGVVLAAAIVTGGAAAAMAGGLTGLQGATTALSLGSSLTSGYEASRQGNTAGMLQAGASAVATGAQASEWSDAGQLASDADVALYNKAVTQGGGDASLQLKPGTTITKKDLNGAVDRLVTIKTAQANTLRINAAGLLSSGGKTPGMNSGGVTLTADQAKAFLALNGIEVSTDTGSTGTADATLTQGAAAPQPSYMFSNW